MLGENDITITRGKCNHDSGNANYHFVLHRKITVTEFIDDILSNVHKWGDIFISSNNNLKSVYTYGHGKLNRQLAKKYSNINITSIDGYGGRISMSYWINYEGEYK